MKEIKRAKERIRERVGGRHLYRTDCIQERPSLSDWVVSDLQRCLLREISVRAVRHEMKHRNKDVENGSEQRTRSSPQT